MCVYECFSKALTSLAILARPCLQSWHDEQVISYTMPEKHAVSSIIMLPVPVVKLGQWHQHHICCRCQLGVGGWMHTII